MRLEDIRVLGRCYALGCKRKQKNDKTANDEARWITIHPSGKGAKAGGSGNKTGRRVLIDSDSGIILKGMGGAFKGKPLSQISAIGTGLKNKSSNTKTGVTTQPKTEIQNNQNTQQNIPDTVNANTNNANQSQQGVGTQAQPQSQAETQTQATAPAKTPDYAGQRQAFLRGEKYFKDADGTEYYRASSNGGWIEASKLKLDSQKDGFKEAKAKVNSPEYQRIRESMAKEADKMVEARERGDRYYKDSQGNEYVAFSNGWQPAYMAKGTALESILNEERQKASSYAPKNSATQTEQKTEERRSAKKILTEGVKPVDRPAEVIEAAKEYQEEKDWRKFELEERAEKAQRKVDSASSRLGRAVGAFGGIGQLNVSGRMNGAINRIDQAMGAYSRESDKASSAWEKAQNYGNSKAISLRDPEAPYKLMDKLNTLLAYQKKLVDINKDLRKVSTEEERNKVLANYGLKPGDIKIHPRTGQIDGYTLANNNGSIRQVRKQLAKANKIHGTNLVEK